MWCGLVVVPCDVMFAEWMRAKVYHYYYSAEVTIFVFVDGRVRAKVLTQYLMKLGTWSPVHQVEQKPETCSSIQGSETRGR